MESSSSTTTSDGTGSGLGPFMDNDGLMYQNYRGQLKISVYVNYGLLTVHVVQARHLSPKNMNYCNTFVKLSLVPDESKRTKCKTETIPDSISPLFDEKFSFELLQEDMRKRLLISVWNRSSGRENANELLGCMSFGIKHILPERKTINGWYYLLSEDVGRRKHLQAAAKSGALKDKNMGSIPQVNQDVMCMDPHTIFLRRAKGGYGFTVIGASPVKVSRVEPGGPAEAAGLQAEDYIIRVDTINVSRSTSDGVAKVIKNTGKKMMIEIQRARRIAHVNNYQWPPRYTAGETARWNSHTSRPLFQQPNVPPPSPIEEPFYMGPPSLNQFHGLYNRAGSDQSIQRYGSDQSVSRCGSDQSNYRSYDLMENYRQRDTMGYPGLISHAPSCHFHPSAGLLISPRKVPPNQVTVGRMGVEVWIDDPSAIAEHSRNSSASHNSIGSANSAELYGTLPRGKKKVTFKTRQNPTTPL